MVLAYILITVKNRQGSRIAAELVKSKYVDNIHLLYGMYDMILRVKAIDLDDLHKFTVETLSKIKDIDRTATLIVADKTKEDNKI
ncbi:MAG: Lrp/AsnC ligand binding domain-containing protein [Nanoarchaeota archaeon]|nr:Lrp/AsnC ligand binding domain-containing protein [Nanoarchaeota archaeon]MBU0962838.1 Lrp/AsnC ligand binding domain-containing protein [Nanoarchaeota archaeon]